MKTHENIMFWFVRIVKQSDLSPDSIEIPCPMPQVAPSHLALSHNTAQTDTNTNKLYPERFQVHAQ